MTEMDWLERRGGKMEENKNERIREDIEVGVNIARSEEEVQ